MKGLLTEKDVEQIKQFLLTQDLSGWFKNSEGGEYLQAFQRQFAEFCKVKHALACSSGSASIYLALKALGVGTQHFVLVPTYTHVGSVAPIVLAGAIPVFADCDQWGNIKVTEQHCSLGLSAIIAVHQLGLPCNIDYIKQMCPGTPIIEDASHAMGSMYKGKPVGILGDIACFSVGGGRTKTIGLGEGGVVVTNNDIDAKNIMAMRNHGDRYCNTPYFCFNFRISELNALIGYLQMERIDSSIKYQEDNAHYIADFITDHPNLSYLELVPLPNYVTKHCRYIILCRIEKHRQKFLDHMKPFQIGPREFVGGGYTKLISDVRFYSGYSRYVASDQSFPNSETQRDIAIWIDYHRYPRTTFEIDVMLSEMCKFHA